MMQFWKALRLLVGDFFALPAAGEVYSAIFH